MKQDNCATCTSFRCRKCRVAISIWQEAQAEGREMNGENCGPGWAIEPEVQRAADARREGERMSDREDVPVLTGPAARDWTLVSVNAAAIAELREALVLWDKHHSDTAPGEFEDCRCGACKSLRHLVAKARAAVGDVSERPEKGVEVSDKPAPGGEGGA